jgi:hypothetical protein
MDRPLAIQKDLFMSGSKNKSGSKPKVQAPSVKKVSPKTVVHKPKVTKIQGNVTKIQGSDKGGQSTSE